MVNAVDLTCSERDSDVTLGEKQVQADISMQGHGRTRSERGDMHCHMHGTCFSAGKKTWEPRQRRGAFVAFSLFSLEHILQTCWALQCVCFKRCLPMWRRDKRAGRCIWFPWNSIECLSLINLTTYFFFKSACILLIYKKQGAVRSDFMKMIYKPDCQKWRVLRQTNGQKLRADRRRGFRWKRRNNSPQQGSHYLDLQVTVRSQEIPKCFPHFLSYILCQISCNWNHKPSYCWTLFWRKGDSLTLPYEHLITQFLPV